MPAARSLACRPAKLIPAGGFIWSPDDATRCQVVFPQPTPFWADAFVGTYGMIIPKHLFADYIGGKINS